MSVENAIFVRRYRDGWHVWEGDARHPDEAAARHPHERDATARRFDDEAEALSFAGTWLAGDPMIERGIIELPPTGGRLDDERRLANWLRRVDWTP
jgi:hypothetical protein